MGARMVRVALAAALLAACVDDHYACSSDADCNVGVAGRCELDHQCTAFDATCPLARRYTAHSGADSGKCFSDAIVPLDPCASGQPPAPAATTDACAAAVCAAVPSCCATGWADACVQAAQVVCDVQCDTRIAVTAEENLAPLNGASAFALLDLRLGAGMPSYTRVDTAADPRKVFLDWLAPARGGSEPRLAGLDGARANVIITDGTTTSMFPVNAQTGYDSLASVDFDRDGHDKAVFASYSANNGYPANVLDLETGDERDLPVSSQLPLTTFGDWDADPFPDAATATSGGGQTYQLLHNVDTDDHTRGFDIAWATGATAATMNNAPLQAFAYADLDSDGVMDLIEFGAEVRIHYGNDSRPPNSPRVQIDCDPLALNPPMTCVGSDVEVIGTPVFTSAGSELAISIDNGTRSIYPVTFTGKTAVLHPATTTMSCTGTGGCPPLRVIVARDIDGDHALDLIAIDAALTVYVRLATGTTMTINPPTGLPAASFKVVRASVTGAVKN